jgi:hypothetical protein
MYVCRLLCRILGRTAGSASEEAGLEISEIVSPAPVILPAAVVVGASSTEDLVGQSDFDSMLCNDGEAEIVDADGIPHTKHFPERIAGAVQGGFAYIGNKWDAMDNVAENLTQKVGTKATSVKDKAVETVGKGKASAEGKAMKHSKQLEGMINSKVNKLRSNSTYSALEASAAKYEQQASHQLEGVADKTKAAASFMRTKSGVIASSARTKSGELASTTKDKLQAAGQNGLRVMAKTLSFNRGGA